jgi:type II secretory pathway pseudopilin PulG
MSVLIGLVFITLNPLKQLQKSQDAQREHDLKQLNNALDTYYNDKNCYPTDLSKLSGATVYIKKVPSDPAASGGWENYVYETDGSSCPQWNVLYARVSTAPNSSIACPLTQMSLCFPTQSGEYNYCVLSGEVDCSTIQAFGGLSAGGGSAAPTTSSTPTPTSAPTTSSTPTPTPTPAFFCSCSTGAGYRIQGEPSCQFVGIGAQPPSGPADSCDPLCQEPCTPP